MLLDELYGLVRFTDFWKRDCGFVPPSGCTGGRHKFGTRQERSHQGARCWSWQLWRLIPQQLCGEDHMVLQHQQGIKVLGTPLGQPDFVAAQLEMLSAKHRTFVDRSPVVDDLQCAWLLVVHCACARANHIARVVELQTAEAFCLRHDNGLWQRVCNNLRISPDEEAVVVQAASMPMVLGDNGLRSAHRVGAPAYWASWADSLPVIARRHLRVAAQLVERQLVQGCSPVHSLQTVPRRCKVARQVDLVHRQGCLRCMSNKSRVFRRREVQRASVHKHHLRQRQP